MLDDADYDNDDDSAADGGECNEEHECLIADLDGYCNETGQMLKNFEDALRDDSDGLPLESRARLIQMIAECHLGGKSTENQRCGTGIGDLSNVNDLLNRLLDVDTMDRAPPWERRTALVAFADLVASLMEDVDAAIHDEYCLRRRHATGDESRKRKRGVGAKNRAYQMLLGLQENQSVPRKTKTIFNKHLEAGERLSLLAGTFHDGTLELVPGSNVRYPELRFETARSCFPSLKEICATE